jgi:magnesium-transporting ATPase (P-type)
MENKLQQHLKKLHQYDNERKGWLILSGFVAATVFGITYNWNLVIESNNIWLFGTTVLILTVIWWYWTMKVISHLIQSKTDEYTVLTEIVKDIKIIRENIRFTVTEPVDKDK